MGTRASLHGGPPDWEALYSVAQSQSGYFMIGQAAAAGYSPQLLRKYIENGKVVRVRRGIYRLVHFPASEYEDLAVAWLWAEQAGVFSHETALALHAGTPELLRPACRPWQTRRS
jgi:predicted transcriptional regulator of viral defense system